MAEFLAFLTGVGAVGVDSTGSTQEEEVRLKSARIHQKSSAQLEPRCRLGSIACADAGGLDYRTPLVDFRLKQRSERFGRRAFDNDAE